MSCSHPSPAVSLRRLLPDFRLALAPLALSPLASGGQAGLTAEPLGFDRHDWGDLERTAPYGSEKESRYAVDALVFQIEDWPDHYHVELLFGLYSYTAYPNFRRWQFWPRYSSRAARQDSRTDSWFLPYILRFQFLRAFRQQSPLADSAGHLFLRRKGRPAQLALHALGADSSAALCPRSRLRPARLHPARERVLPAGALRVQSQGDRVAGGHRAAAVYRVRPLRTLCAGPALLSDRPESRGHLAQLQPPALLLATQSGLSRSGVPAGSGTVYAVRRSGPG